MTHQSNIMTEIDFSTWIGRSEDQKGAISELDAIRIHAALSDGQAAPALGAQMPPLWHWYAFPPTTPTDALGRDGHPRLGGFLPPLPFERRMWASGDMTFHAPLIVGETLLRRSQITDVQMKSGASGDMAFVTVAHQILQNGTLCVSETQNLVYLHIPQSFAPPPKKAPPTSGMVATQSVDASETLLFRYSAITFNSHRIHYDLPYAQEVEKYPGLVVHGPLQASLLMAQACTAKGKAPTRFAFRGVHPMFAGEPLMLIATNGSDAGELKLCTAVPGSHQGMQASAIWEDT